MRMPIKFDKVDIKCDADVTFLFAKAQLEQIETDIALLEERKKGLLNLYEIWKEKSSYKEIQE